MKKLIFKKRTSNICREIEKSTNIKFQKKMKKRKICYELNWIKDHDILIISSGMSFWPFETREMVNCN